MWAVLWLALALAGTKADARDALEAGRLEEAAGLYRLELLRHPGRPWAMRGLAAAVSAQATRHLSEAERYFADGLVVPGRDAADQAIRLLERGAKDGAPVEVEPARQQRARMIRDAAEAARSRAGVALQAGRFQEAVSALGVARELEPDDGEPLAEAHRAWARWYVGQGAPVEAAKQYEAAVALVGHSADREAAARLYAEAASASEAAGDCGKAAWWLRLASHLDSTYEPALRDAEACAAIPVVLQVRPAEGMAAAGLADRITEVLTERVEERLVVTSPSGAADTTLSDGLVVRVVLEKAQVDKGEVTDKRGRRRGKAGVTKIYMKHTMDIAVTWTGRLVVRRGGEVVHQGPLRAAAQATARWDGKVVAIQTVGGRSKTKGKKTGEKAPAMRSATADAEAAVMRALANDVVAAVAPLVAATPPPRPEGRP